MQVINSTKTVYFDVDNTLVYSAKEYPELAGVPWVNINGRDFYIHELHLECLKDFKARGHTVVVWSAGGAEWSAMVVRALGAEAHVDVAISKPDWYFDDKKSEEFMVNYSYYTLNTHRGF